jgi:hypothetical protein
MEDFTLGLFTKTRSSHARLNVPALVQVAAFAIILNPRPGFADDPQPAWRSGNRGFCPSQRADVGAHAGVSLKPGAGIY